MAIRSFLFIVLLCAGKWAAADSHANSAAEAFAAGDYQQAISLYGELIDAGKLDEPDLVRALTARARSLLKISEFKQARADLDRALLLQPDEVPAHLALGDLNRMEGNYDEAIADYSRAIEITADDAIAYNRRGEVLFQKGEFQNAIEDFSTAVNLTPEVAGNYYNRGLANHELGDLEMALLNYNQAIRLDPGFNLAHKYRGVLNLRNGEFSDAVADFNQVLAADPNSVISQQQRGYAHYLSGDFAAAAADFGQVAHALGGYVNAALWGYLAMEHGVAGGGADFLRQQQAKIDTKAWPGILVSYYLGYTGESELLEIIDAHPRSVEKAEMAALAHFYLGQLQLLSEDQDGAMKSLQLVVDTPGMDRHIEYQAAKHQLNNI